MTRQKWTTKEQEIWLDQHKSAFLEANQKKSAGKDFFPGLTKAFRDKWPVPAPMQEEINDAGSIELATRVKQGKYDKRTTAWFHNNTRSVNSNGNGILSIKPKQQRRMLQPWQAYHALTYETRWKSDVNTVWSNYKSNWAAENPKEKPPKNRFQIMIEFMKEKFEAETEEMKTRCEEYRVARQHEAESPDPVKSDSARNIAFQEAIDMLPRTLATIGDSLMSQTGWHVSILMGGPAPDNDGTIMTYLSHTGKTKAGESFEKFLGNQDYDRNVLVPFEKFLHASFSVEDCAARRLVKPEETEEMNSGEIQQTNDDEGDSVKEKTNDDTSENPDDDEATTESGGKSQYEKNKERNVAQLKDIIAQLQAKFPMPELEVARKELSKVTAAVKGKQGRKEPTARRESQRTKDKISASALPQAAIATSTPTPLPTDSSVPPAVSTTADLPTPNTAGIEKSSSAALVGDVASSCAETTITPAHTDDALDALQPVVPIAHVEPTDTSISISRKPDGDVVMGDEPTATQKPINDENLPPWLLPMIKYLRGVAVDTAWQNLVTEFIEFEKGSPPAGKLPTKFRPREISDWIKSKKKDVVPLIEPAEYGQRFMDWWTFLQPPWQKDSVVSLVHFRDIPSGETWQVLKKGGTAGIYVVVMALSWWIKAQQQEHVNDTWSTVDDLLWVIQQMNRNMVSRMPVPEKRARDEDEGDEEEDQQRKSRRRRSG